MSVGRQRWASSSPEQERRGGRARAGAARWRARAPSRSGAVASSSLPHSSIAPARPDPVTLPLRRGRGGGDGGGEVRRARVGSVPKMRAATKQWLGWLRFQNESSIQPNPLIPQPNTREIRVEEPPVARRRAGAGTPWRNTTGCKIDGMRSYTVIPVQSVAKNRRGSELGNKMPPASHNPTRKWGEIIRSRGPGGSRTARSRWCGRRRP